MERSANSAIAQEKRFSHRTIRERLCYRSGRGGERDMSKHSKKGFRKLENHELSEFTTLHGEDSGSDTDMIEMERENVSKRGGG